MPTRKQKKHPETGFLQFINRKQRLQIPKKRFAKIKKLVQANQEYYSKMEKIKLAKENEPSTFLGRLIEMSEQPD